MEAQLKAAAEAKAAAEKAAAQADAKSKEAVGVQQNVAKELDAATKKAKPANINVASPSPTVTLKVTAAPVTLGDAPAATVKQGASVEVPLSVSRLYGFADVVQVTTKVPDGAKAVKVANVDVPADQAQAMLKIETGADTPPGKHVLVVTATAKYNGQNLTVSREVPLTVEAAAAAEAARVTRPSGPRVPLLACAAVRAPSTGHWAEIGRVLLAGSSIGDLSVRRT